MTLPLELPRILPEPWSVDLGKVFLTPENLYPLLGPRQHEGLLLSGGAHPLSRSSYIGLDPFLVVTAKGNQVSLLLLPRGPCQTLTADPFRVLDSILNFYRHQPPPGPSSFRGGGIGYFGYELGRLIEKLPDTAKDDLDLPDLYFAFFRSVLAYSHRERNYALYGLRLACEASAPGSGGADLERTCERIVRAAQGVPSSQDERPPDACPLSIESNFSREQYLQAILKAKHYIVEGDIYQVNLSQRFHTRHDGDSYRLFRKLFEINPAPFFAFLNPGPFQILSSSPERFLRLNGREVETRPIKGTLPRGKTPEADLRNGESLMQSEKNRAELAMITDLMRNDLGRVCEYGSVRVLEDARLEAYANVFHLVSIVTGRLAQGKSGMDLLRATFPGGSITGCPKIRSMEIIDEIESTVRSAYTGSIGYLGWNGDMDLSIAIRSIIRKETDLYFQVGGGIVYDSDPAWEYEETLHKAASMKEAIEKTCGW